MNGQAVISSITAFIIASGGALLVVVVGGKPDVWQIVASVVLGLVVAAKDLRTLYKLPPVDTTKE